MNSAASTRPELHRLALVVEHLVDDAETVALAQVAVKIDVGRENIGNLRRDRVGKPAASVAPNKRVADLGRFHQHAPLEFGRRFVGAELIAAALDAQQIAAAQIAQADAACRRRRRVARTVRRGSTGRAFGLRVVAQELERGVVVGSSRASSGHGIAALNAFFVRIACFGVADCARRAAPVPGRLAYGTDLFDGVGRDAECGDDAKARQQ